MDEAIIQYLDGCVKAIIAETEARNNTQIPQEIRDVCKQWFKMGADCMRTYVIASLGGKQ